MEKMEKDINQNEIQLCFACLDCLNGKKPKQRPLITKKGENLYLKLAEPNLESCALCMGIQPLIFNSEVLEHIVENIRGSKYEFDRFKLNFHISPCIKLRQNVIAAHMGLRSGAGGIALPGEIFDVKQSLKLFLQEFLSEKWNVPISAKEEFVITFNFENNEIDAQFLQSAAKLLTQLSSIAASRKHQKISVLTQNQVDIILMAGIDELIQTFSVSDLNANLGDMRLRLELKTQNGFIKGLYNKYSRNISQTTWLVDGTVTLSGSVEEHIAPTLCEIFRSESYKFHAAGREDIDVCMLGDGRPFVVELISPKRLPSDETLLLTKAASRINLINPAVQVSQLSTGSRLCLEDLLHGAEKKVKAYCAVVNFLSPPNMEVVLQTTTMRNVLIKQTTPIRVLHRRTLMSRNKIIHELRWKALSENLFLLFLLTSAGTYIKEFVHGDLQRTIPNIGTLIGVSADIQQLDVLGLFDSYNESTVLAFNDIVESL